jgi:rod shape-determining protein MreB
MKIPLLTTLSDSFTKLVGVDLGTSYIRIWTYPDGLVVNEPSCLAVDQRTSKIMAAGQDALAMQGRVGDHITLYRPFQQGQLSEPESAAALLRVLLQRVLRSSYFFRPTVMVSVPAGTSDGVRQATVELLYSVGAREVYTIAQPLAAAIGAGVPIADASGSFIFHLGSGVVEAAVISLGSLVEFESMTYAGNYLDQQLVLEVKKQTGLAISPESAQHLKQTIATLLPDTQRSQLTTGKDSTDGSPKELTLTSSTLAKPVTNLAERYEQLLKKLLSRIPPELTVDVIDKGMLLTGGQAQLSGLDQFLIARLGIPVSVVEQPELAAIRGIGTALEHLDLFKESLGYQHVA